MNILRHTSLISISLIFIVIYMPHIENFSANWTNPSKSESLMYVAGEASLP